MDAALQAVEAAHCAHARGQAIDHPRVRTRVPTAALHILQGALLDRGVFGYKAYSSSRQGIHFRVYLFRAADGAFLAEIEANRLGMMRTGAAGGLAARCLAREEASRVGLFGCGWQAQSQIEALCRVRPIRQVKVFSRDEARRAAFCAAQSQRLAIDVKPARDAQDAVQDADIIVTITPASRPVFDGHWIAPGTHINAAGANALIRRELDDVTVRRAQIISVDTRATALSEAGDLHSALEKGHIHPGQLVELGALLTGQHRGRSSSEAITLFESQGLAIQDLAVAATILEQLDPSWR